ncbi:hypothetical protein Nocox_24030 [Nonomuraea coxensis DSM 45129]|uniref:Uncharacterized protein n=1 Tax=Nonomuraea coxensis DSM 45129 TaxID=1122611 RepID=A0ABX8U419_9ACTN|nr:hypothetical protein [Nonomuraea coxensis]QYC42409.1 hypothetical protein Nocox_24030 [Nonomuraea coxensis DSM 45129]
MGKRLLPALGLFLLSPLAGEFLLGNLPVTALPALVVLAPLYGGGALLIRELARRRGAGWPGMVLLAVAYGLVEEGLLTRSLFDPHFAGMDLASYAWLPGVGVSAWWASFVLGGVHAAGSVLAPIAVMEALVPSRAEEPWLGRPGLVVAGVLYVLGAAATGLTNPDAYRPSAAQLVGAAVVAALLSVLALPRRPPATTPAGGAPRRAPGPWTVLGLTLVAGLAFWLAALPLDVLGAWPAVAANLALYGAAYALVARWARRAGWGLAQRLALGAGWLLTYAWHSFPQPPALPATPGVDLAGNVAFAVAAVALLTVAWSRVRAAARGAAEEPVTL